MSKNPEFDRIQHQILKQLFDAGDAVTLQSIQTAIGKSLNEARYHCDELNEANLIQSQSIILNHKAHEGYIINALGRKKIMEG